MKKLVALTGLALAVNILVVPNQAEARSAVLIDPDIVEFDCKLSMKQAEKAVKAGMRTRKWTPKTKEPGHLEGRVVVRGKHTLWVDIYYTQKSFDVNYKDSDNLNYKVKKDGVRYLHPNANSWMDNLVQDIAQQAYSLCP